jgi:ferredoxin-thioredoxin reductase catalytic subunit
MKDMLKMMIEFFRDVISYRKELKKHDGWIKKYASNKGYSINPHWMFYTNLKLWLIESENLFGKRYCPCFEPSGDPEFDRKLICPCEFMHEEIKEQGTCHCTLFGRKDLTGKEYKEAEARLLEEYRGEINLQNRVLDTRGVPIDPLRNLPVPDPLHQTKRALSMIGTPLKVIVEKKVYAEHIVLLALKRGLKAEVNEENDFFVVDIS